MIRTEHGDDLESAKKLVMSQVIEAVDGEKWFCLTGRLGLGGWKVYETTWKTEPEVLSVGVSEVLSLLGSKLLMADEDKPLPVAEFVQLNSVSTEPSLEGAAMTEANPYTGPTG